MDKIKRAGKVIAAVLINAAMITLGAWTMVHWTARETVQRLNGGIDYDRLPACASEDGGPVLPCAWDPYRDGNGQAGPVYVVLLYVEHGAACPDRVRNGYLCLNAG